MNKFCGSYLPSDVNFLLDICHVDEITVDEKEDLLSAKMHYSETLTEEINFSQEYINLFHQALDRQKQTLTKYVVSLACYLSSRSDFILISLARAGTPFGVILKRVLSSHFKREIFHYSISIIKDKGIDIVAINDILNIHGKKSEFIFVDGWTGKGSIYFELCKSLDAKFPAISFQFITIADIAGVADVCATRDDFLIPSCLLNSSISGLISRTLINDTEGKYHRVKYFEDKKSEDYSLYFIDKMQSECSSVEQDIRAPLFFKYGTKFYKQFFNSLEEFQNKYQLPSINLIKPGLGETIRMVIRRGAKYVVVRDHSDVDILPIVYLAQRKNVLIKYDSSLPFKCIGVLNY